MVPSCTVELNKLMNELEISELVSELEVSSCLCERERFAGYVGRRRDSLALFYVPIKYKYNNKIYFRSDVEDF